MLQPYIQQSTIALVVFVFALLLVVLMLVHVYLGVINTICGSLAGVLMGLGYILFVSVT